MSSSGEDNGVKPRPEHIESSVNLATEVPTYHAGVDTSGIDEKKLLRKIDLRLIPWLSLLYLLSFLDRTSIGNAKLYSLEKDLGLTDKQYLIALTIFFFSYAIFEVPSNIFLKRLRPSMWLSALMLFWGIMMVSLDVVAEFQREINIRPDRARARTQLRRPPRYALATRHVRGGPLPRSKLLPIMVRTTPTSYKHLVYAFHLQLVQTYARNSGFAQRCFSARPLLAGRLAASEGNPPGYVTLHRPQIDAHHSPGMDIHSRGEHTIIPTTLRRTHDQFRILQGLATVLAGAASFWIIQDFPDDAKFLTEEERAFVVRRLQSDDQFSAAGEKLRVKCAIRLGLAASGTEALKDWKTWLGMLCYAGSDGPLYAFSLFTPSIINQLASAIKPWYPTGYTATPANLLSVPVYAWACLLTIGVGYMADRIGRRGMFNLIFFTIGLAGYIILICSRNAALSYFAVYLAASGIYPLIPNTIAWMSNNVEGSYKRSVALGMVISLQVFQHGNINGAVSSNIYRARDKPWYRLGHGIVLMYIVIGWVTSLAFILLLRRENEKRARGERDEVITGGLEEKPGGEAKARGGVYESVEEAKRDKGDAWSGYRYVI
ncbi:hypothetical protein FRC10_006554 [Ceratobasidium sp. 414]|nr:hypothetical protein FRC10_006554 [Ceratobasidium sp. 414]